MALFLALLWGLWWMPVRYLNSIGLEGAWAAVAVSLAALPILLVLVVLGPGFKAISRRALTGTILAATAFTAYTMALDYTDVVRVVLLFYLAPAWSTLIECRFMGRHWSWQIMLAFLCSFIGLLLILGGELSPASIGFGEILALLSGMLWAVGAALLYSSPPANAAQISLIAVAFSTFTSLAAALATGASAGSAAEFLDIFLDYRIYFIGCVFFAPMLAITIWAAWKLPPALMSYLLTTEIISGVVSSVIFLDEKFGGVEFFGAVAIILGATIELVLPKGLVMKEE
ncbi:MAG: DMT family transporter [Rhodobacteraceae bacterium]|nr:DMT family transporter [Paracoccaceae bacterium]